MIKKVKEQFLRIKPHCNIGTIGHVDHGKTTLTAAITKVLSNEGTNTNYIPYENIDKHREERTRGITITAAHVEYETAERHYTHIDCPGHQDYIKNMITGAIQMEGVILVVSVTEGPQIQTREHIILAKEIGIAHMVIYINKMDALKEKDLFELVEMEILELVDSYGFGNSPMVAGSAQVALDEGGQSKRGYYSIIELMEKVDAHVPLPVREVDLPFLMPIEEVFSIRGRGTVVTGKVDVGTLHVNDEVELVGTKSYKSVCLGLEMFHKILDKAIAGDNVGILVRGITRTLIQRGFVASEPGRVVASNHFTAKAYILKKSEGGRKNPFFSGYSPQFFFRTSNITGKVELLDSELAVPGDDVKFTVTLVTKVALALNLRFTIREGSCTVGAGYIIEIKK